MEYRLPCDVASIRLARRLATDFAEDRLSDMQLDDLALMVSEIISNAVRHGSREADGNIGLLLEEDQDVLRVVVTDGGQVFAFHPKRIDPDSDEHFGLLLVDELADRWGVSLDGNKAIWLEVDTRPRPIGRYRTARMYGGAVGERESTTCPICGKGTLRTVDFGDQQPDSREVQTFTCGHEVKGGRLRTADADGLDVERRQSEETVTPIDPEE